MADVSLVPVDHQPDFSDVSLIPVDHDPFSADEVTQPVQAQPEQPQPGQNQPSRPPQQPATGPDLPDVGAPLIDDGGQFSPGAPWANKAADIASKLVGNAFRDAINLAATPGAIMQPNPYPPGSEEALWYDGQREQLINKAAPAMALTMLGGSGLVPVPAGTVLGANRLMRGVATVATHHNHHPWPMYLGGAVQQELVRLPIALHKEFHRRLNKHLPQQRGTAHYESLSPTKRQDALRTLAEETKKFDAEHGTKLYDAMLKNGFPEP